MASEDDAPAELEHVIGFSCRHANTYLVHPTDVNLTVHAVGQLALVGDLADPLRFCRTRILSFASLLIYSGANCRHKQDILRYHDAEVCALAISPCGQYIASGQVFTPKV